MRKPCIGLVTSASRQIRVAQFAVQRANHRRRDCIGDFAFESSRDISRIVGIRSKDVNSLSETGTKTRAGHVAPSPRSPGLSQRPRRKSRICMCAQENPLTEGVQSENSENNLRTNSFRGARIGAASVISLSAKGVFTWLFGHLDSS